MGLEQRALRYVLCRARGQPKRVIHGLTRKGTLLERVRLGVTTWIVLLVAPIGTVAATTHLDATVNVAGVPLNVTLVAPVRFVPRILTALPTLPKFVCVSTNGPKPTDKLKAVPQPLGQALLVPP